MIRSSPDRLPRELFIYLQVLWTLLVWAIVVYAQTDSGVAGIGTALEVALLLNLLWTAASWRGIGGDLFGPYLIFVCASAVFNSGQSFLELLGLNANGLLNYRFQAAVVARTEALVLAGGAAVHLGAMVSFGRRPMEAPSTPASELAWSRRIGALMLVVAVPALFIVLIPAMSVVATGGYQSLYLEDFVGGFSSAPRILASLAVPAAMFLLAGSHGHALAKLSSVALISLVVGSQLALGYRAPGTMPLVMYAWLWHRTVRRIPPGAVLAGVAVLLMVVFPTLAAIRGLSGDERLSLDTAVEAYSAIENPLVASVTEMGSSMSTVAYTLEYVPEIRAFDMGASYWYAALTVIPNLFWDVHPAVERGNLSRWLIEIVDPWVAARGGGIGYSHIAEAYLNFGVFAWLPLVLLGVCLGLAEGWASRSTATRAAAVAAAFAFLLFFVRAESVSVIRPLLWFAAAPYAAVAFAVRIPVGGASRPAPDLVQPHHGLAPDATHPAPAD